MDFLKKYKTTIIGVIIILVIFFAYQFFFSGGTGGNPLVSVTPANTTESTAGLELLSLLLELRSITLDNDLFDSSSFQNLVDFTVDIIPEPVGRSNPFAPIGVGGPPVSFDSLPNLDDLGDLDELDEFDDIF